MWSMEVASIVMLCTENDSDPFFPENDSDPFFPLTPLSRQAILRVPEALKKITLTPFSVRGRGR